MVVETLVSYAPYLASIVVPAVILVVFLRRRKHVASSSDGDYPKDTVILHTMTKGTHAPSMSAFVLKLETYLRVANIPYQTIYRMERGPKGKIPFINYNGQTVCDSQMCMEFLNKKLSLDLDKNLAPEQKATAHAFRKLVEEHTYWLVLLTRWVHYQAESRQSITRASKLLVWYIAHNLKKQSYQQGLGRHSPEEVAKLLLEDLQSISVYLGNKKFFLGDEPTELDCTMFGQLAQIKWHCPDCPAKRKLTEDLVNLDQFCERMKEKYWPDWEECITGFK